MYESHQDFTLVWCAYQRWRERAQQLGFDPERALSIGCIGIMQRFGVLVCIELSEADLNDILSFDLYWLDEELETGRVSEGCEPE